MTVKLSKLNNGLTIATESRADMRSIALGLWVKAGSRSEREDQRGLAHLLEHMAFKGTKTRTAQEIAAAIENVGGDINAATSMETTGYFIRVLSSDLELAADILGDIITAPRFDEKELEREKQVIAQEIGAADDTPDDVVFDLFTESAYPGQPLGRPILGSKESVQSFSAADLRAFMDEHYFGENIVAVACGAVEHEAFAALMAKRLEALPASAMKKQDFKPARYQGGDSRKNRDLMDTQILLGFEGCPAKDKNFYAAQILAMILGGGMSSRLFQEVREKRGLCYSIYAFHWAFQDTGLFGIHTATDEAGMQALMPVLTQELRACAANISELELERAKNQYAAGLIMGQESLSARASAIARRLFTYGFVKTDEEILREVRAVDTETVRKLAEKLFFGSVCPSFAAIGKIEHLPSFKAISAPFADKN